MKSKVFLFLLMLGIISGALGQNTIDLTFTAVDSAAYVQLDSIKIMNRTQGGDTVLYWPDTVLSLYYVGIHENPSEATAFQIFHNYPNPVAERTTISLYVPEKDKVSIMVTDILGHVFVKSERVLDKGKHFFRFTPGIGSLCFFSATWQGKRSSINILQTNSSSDNTYALEHIGYENSSLSLKTTSDIQSFFYNLGDQLLYIGYFDTLQSGMLNVPESIETCTFQFASNIPCPGTPTVEYEGQIYNTIQIFSQCWLKENLNVGTMIGGGSEMSDNGIIEKYCYSNNMNNCNNYGGLYQWNEMMQYSTQQGSQGICPQDWHIPTDEEWKVLEGVADSLYEIGNQIWDSYGLRGYDVGTNLKTTTGWSNNGNGNDLLGFSGIPGGYRYNNGFFYYLGMHGLWWSSTDGNSTCAWNRYTSYNNPQVDRDFGNDNKEFGFSVRCIKDD